MYMNTQESVYLVGQIIIMSIRYSVDYIVEQIKLKGEIK